MQTAGIFLTFILVAGGLVLSQGVFYSMTGRIYWRAFLPAELRFMVLKNDKVKMDSFMVMEEFAALILMGSFLMLPLIALGTSGFLDIF